MSLLCNVTKRSRSSCNILLRAARLSARALFCSRRRMVIARVSANCSVMISLALKVSFDGVVLSVMLFSYARDCAICIVSVDLLDVHCASS